MNPDKTNADHDRDWLAYLSTPSPFWLQGFSLSSLGSHFLFNLDISDYIKFDIFMIKRQLMASTYPLKDFYSDEESFFQRKLTE